MSVDPASEEDRTPRANDHPDLITNIFMIQSTQDGAWIFRTAGDGVSQLLGRTLPNHDFLALWTGPDRSMVSGLLDAVRLDSAPGVIRGSGETLTGQRVEVEITLMPLAQSSVDGNVTRFLGLYQTLGGLPMPWYPLIGNHDVRDAFFAGLPDTPRDGAGRACYRLDVDAGRFLVLDTLTEGTHAGLIDAEQLAWLEAEIAASTSDVFLFMHHPPMPSGIAGLDNILLNNPYDLAHVLDAYPGRVRHLFFGHMHRAFHGSWRGIPFSTVKATAHQVFPTLEKGRPLVSSREMPAYAVVLVSAESVAIHDVSYLEEDLAFDYDRNAGR